MKNRSGILRFGPVWLCIALGVVIHAAAQEAGGQGLPEQENAQDLVRRGVDLMLGLRGTIDEAEAKECFTRASELGYAVGTMWVARCHQWGNCSPDELAGIFQEVEELAEQGDAYAAYLVAEAYGDYDDRCVVQNDYNKAAEWYRKAAEAGLTLSMDRLGCWYSDGIGVPIDEKKAFEWCRKAADAGEGTAMYSLGCFYARGAGVPRDEKKAFEWSRKAADAGYVEAMRGVAHAYAHGNGVPEDFTKAVEWYRKAADAGYVEALNTLGDHYGRGEGVPKDDAKAVEWYRKAADAGYAYGMHNLAAHYEFGLGVPRDKEQAYLWYKKAIEAGHSSLMGNETDYYKTVRQWVALLREIEAAERTGDVGMVERLLCQAKAQGLGRGEPDERLADLYASEAWRSSRPKVTVQEFEVGEGLSVSGKFLCDALISELVASGRYTVPDWEEMDRLFEYFEKSEDNLEPDEATKQRVMKQVGVSQVLRGSLHQVGSIYYVTVKVLNLDLTVTKTVQESVTSEEALRECISKVAKRLIEGT